MSRASCSEFTIQFTNAILCENAHHHAGYSSGHRRRWLQSNVLAAYWRQSVIFQSCKFHPCDFVRHFPVLQIPPLRLRPSFSTPANSSPANSAIPCYGPVTVQTLRHFWTHLSRHFSRTCLNLITARLFCPMVSLSQPIGVDAGKVVGSHRQIQIQEGRASCDPAPSRVLTVTGGL